MSEGLGDRWVVKSCCSPCGIWAISDCDDEFRCDAFNWGGCVLKQRAWQSRLMLSPTECSSQEFAGCCVLAPPVTQKMLCHLSALSGMQWDKSSSTTRFWSKWNASMCVPVEATFGKHSWEWSWLNDGQLRECWKSLRNCVSGSGINWIPRGRNPTLVFFDVFFNTVLYEDVVELRFATPWQPPVISNWVILKW